VVKRKREREKKMVPYTARPPYATSVPMKRVTIITSFFVPLSSTNWKKNQKAATDELHGSPAMDDKKRERRKEKRGKRKAFTHNTVS